MIDFVTNVLRLFLIIHLTQERVNSVLSIDGYIKYIYISQCKCTDVNHICRFVSCSVSLVWRCLNVHVARIVRQRQTTVSLHTTWFFTSSMLCFKKQSHEEKSKPSDSFNIRGFVLYPSIAWQSPHEAKHCTVCNENQTKSLYYYRLYTITLICTCVYYINSHIPCVCVSVCLFVTSEISGTGHRSATLLTSSWRASPSELQQLLLELIWRVA